MVDVPGVPDPEDAPPDVPAPDVPPDVPDVPPDVPEDGVLVEPVPSEDPLEVPEGAAPPEDSELLGAGLLEEEL